MALFALAILLIIIFFYDSKKFVYALMVFFVLFDMLDGFYEEQKVFAAARYLIPLLLIAFLVIRQGALKKPDLLFILFSLYLLVLLVYAQGDIIISGKTVLAIILTLLMIPVGRYIGRNGNFLEEFESFNRFLLIALPLYIVIANIYNFGESYSDSFTTGFLVTSRIYIMPIVVFLAIHYVISNRDRSWTTKGIDLALIMVNICIILINTRRTALAMLLLALIVYTILNRRIILKMAILGIFLISALIVAYPLYEEMLVAQLEERQRIQDLDTYEEEGRYLETLYILDHHAQRQSITEFLFGVKLFDTYDFGNHYFGRDRPIHSDINMIFYSTGLTGTLLSFLMFFRYFFLGNHRISRENKKVYYALLGMFLIVLLPGRFIGTLTYAPLLMLLLSAVKASKREQIFYPPKVKSHSGELAMTRS